MDKLRFFRLAERVINIICFTLRPSRGLNEDTPLDVERLQFAVVHPKALLLHELLDVRVGLPVDHRGRKWKCFY
jgi:hypothetical protein